MKKIYRLKLTSSNSRNLFLFEKVTKPLRRVYLPKKIKRFVLQKSPFVQSKAKEHFELCQYKRLYFFELTFFELKKILLLIPNDVLVRLEQEHI